MSPCCVELSYAYFAAWVHGRPRVSKEKLDAYGRRASDEDRARSEPQRRYVPSRIAKATLSHHRTSNRPLLLNGKPREEPAELTVAELLLRLEMPSRGIAVELNQQIVPRNRHAEQMLRDGDRIEIVSLVGGG